MFTADASNAEDQNRILDLLYDNDKYENELVEIDGLKKLLESSTESPEKLQE